MKLIKTIKDVKGFALNGTEFKYNSLETVFDENDSNLLNSNEWLQEIKFEKFYYFINDFVGNAYLFINDEIEFFEKTHIRSVFDDENILIFQQNQTHIYNIESKSFKKILDFRSAIFYLDENHIILRNDNKIKAFHFPSGEALWEFDITQYGTYRYAGDDSYYDVKQFLGIYNNTLLVRLKNATLLCLDINTGEQAQLIHIKDQLSTSSSLVADSSDMHLVVSETGVNDKILWFTGHALLHIDLKTFEVKLIKSYADVPHKQRFAVFNNTYQDNKLYFGAEPSYLGIIEADTGEILWKKQLIIAGNVSRPGPQFKAISCMPIPPTAKCTFLRKNNLADLLACFRSFGEICKKCHAIKNPRHNRV